MTPAPDRKSALEAFDRMTENGSWPTSLDGHLDTIRAALSDQSAVDVTKRRVMPDFNDDFTSQEEYEKACAFNRGYNKAIDDLRTPDSGKDKKISGIMKTFSQGDLQRNKFPPRTFVPFSDEKIDFLQRVYIGKGPDHDSGKDEALRVAREAIVYCDERLKERRYYSTKPDHALATIDKALGDEVDSPET